MRSSLVALRPHSSRTGISNASHRGCVLLSTTGSRFTTRKPSPVWRHLKMRYESMAVKPSGSGRRRHRNSSLTMSSPPSLISLLSEYTCARRSERLARRRRTLFCSRIVKRTQPEKICDMVILPSALAMVDCARSMLACALLRKATALSEAMGKPQKPTLCMGVACMLRMSTTSCRLNLRASSCRRAAHDTFFMIHDPSSSSSRSSGSGSFFALLPQMKPPFCVRRWYSRSVFCPSPRQRVLSGMRHMPMKSLDPTSQSYTMTSSLPKAMSSGNRSKEKISFHTGCRVAILVLVRCIWRPTLTVTKGSLRP
mmetsp:Transcript_11408/g.31827  ORF Transcript_11408/g.31827 Transcript_11408/m.31827 type:complete len:311 (-) Transcript_11408:509-1441(-)